MASTRVVIHEDGITEFLKTNKPVRDIMVNAGKQVAAEAAATASAAEKGTGGRITGYADAGFSTEWVDNGTKRPRVEISSNASAETFTAAHFYTQKRDGVAHLRAALYSITTKGA